MDAISIKEWFCNKHTVLYIFVGLVDRPCSGNYFLYYSRYLQRIVPLSNRNVAVSLEFLSLHIAMCSVGIIFMLSSMALSLVF